MKKELQEKDFYKSSDIALCSALCCYGYQIEATDKQNPAKIIFLIKRDERLNDLIKQYFFDDKITTP